MSYFTEQPIWIVMVGMAVLIVLAIGWYQRPRREWIFGMAAVLVIAILLILLSQSIETDNEAIRRTVLELADAVEKNDVNKAASFVSDSEDLVRQRILTEMPSYTFDSCNVAAFDGVKFTPEKNPTKATVSFLVWADVNAPTYGYDGPVRRRVILDFKKEGDDWKLVDYAHEDPNQQGGSGNFNFD